MPILFNGGANPKKVIFNGTSVKKVMFNGVKVWESVKQVLFGKNDLDRPYGVPNCAVGIYLDGTVYAANWNYDGATDKETTTWLEGGVAAESAVYEVRWLADSNKDPLRLAADMNVPEDMPEEGGWMTIYTSMNPMIVVEPDTSGASQWSWGEIKLYIREKANPENIDHIDILIDQR